MKFKISFLVFLLLITTIRLNVYANIEPYKNYIYNSNAVAQEEPQAYLPDKIITGESLGTDPFNGPEDVFVAPDKRIYIVDTRNNRILILSSDFTLQRIIDQFDNQGQEGTFNLPRGVFVTEDNDIYVADTENSRIVVMKENGSLIKILTRPEVSIFQGEYRYLPTSVVVDSAGRIFVVSLNVSEGIIEYDADGEFSTFFGAIRVKRDLSQVLWRAIGEYIPQIKAQLRKNIPTEYSSITLDEHDFIYTTTSIVSLRDEAIFVRRLNPMGIDVLRRNDVMLPNGDVPTLVYNPATHRAEPVYSNLVDIVSLGDGIYSVLDQRRGRVFTYTPNGELMYVFGANGSRFGQFGRAVALNIINEDQYLVVDSQYNQITLFKPTEYGKTIKTAVTEYRRRNYDSAGLAWKNAIAFTAKSRLVYNGYARYLYQKDEYREAMNFFEYAKNDIGYSDAYELHRKKIIDENFTLISILIILFIIAYMIYKKIKKSRRRIYD